MNEQNGASQQRNRNYRKEPSRNTRVRKHSDGNKKNSQEGLIADFK
jgi:hypothetical protein